jgi:FkbM family methyltransferase
MVVWDVGANAGFYTLALSRLVGNGGRVYAFEPLAENVDNILKHVELNDLSSVIVVQAALGERDGLVGFETARLNSMGRISEQEGSYLVPAFTVDAFVAQHPDARPDLLKIDVEGAESGLLRGATQFLRKAAPDIVLALHGETQSRQCFELLTELGYTLYRLDGSPMPATSPGERDEIYEVKRVDSTGASANRLVTPQ